MQVVLEVLALVISICIFHQIVVRAVFRWDVEYITPSFLLLYMGVLKDATQQYTSRVSNCSC
jgi:hypothetical protein